MSDFGIKRVERNSHLAIVSHSELSAQGEATLPVKLSGRVAVQITVGPATEAEFGVERSTIDPTTNEANWCPVFGEFPGAFSTDIRISAGGIAPVVYFDEPAVAWWRVVAHKLNVGQATVSVSGGA